MSDVTKYTTITRYYRNADRFEILGPHTELDGTKLNLYMARRHRGSPKACLVTISDGTRVWFGISRCHEFDNFSRQLGRKMAQGRAEAARTEYPNGSSFIQFQYQRLIGSTTMEKLPELLDIFYTLDKAIYSFMPRYVDEKPVLVAPTHQEQLEVFGEEEITAVPAADGVSY